MSNKVYKYVVVLHNKVKFVQCETEEQVTAVLKEETSNGVGLEVITVLASSSNISAVATSWEPVVHFNKEKS